MPDRRVPRSGPHPTSTMLTIRSKDNAFVKELFALAHASRERKKRGLSVLDGAHLVTAALDCGIALQSVAIAESAAGGDEAQDIAARLAGTDCHLAMLADELMVHVSGLETPAGVIGVVATPAGTPIPDGADVLALDNVQDPGNVGSLLRSAAAAGVRHVAFGRGTAFAWSPKVLRAAQGAHFSLNIVEGADIESFLKSYRGDSLALVANQVGAASLFDTPVHGAVALLLGNEGAGLSPGVLSAAKRRVTLPMPGKIESLNVAAAGAIALFEIVRQRSTK